MLPGESCSLCGAVDGMRRRRTNRRLKLGRSWVAFAVQGRCKFSLQYSSSSNSQQSRQVHPGTTLAPRFLSLSRCSHVATLVCSLLTEVRGLRAVWGAGRKPRVDSVMATTGRRPRSSRRAIRKRTLRGTCRRTRPPWTHGRTAALRPWTLNLQRQVCAAVHLSQSKLAPSSYASTPSAQHLPSDCTRGGGLLRRAVPTGVATLIPGGRPVGALTQTAVQPSAGLKIHEIARSQRAQPLKFLPRLQSVCAQAGRRR